MLRGREGMGGGGGEHDAATGKRVADEKSYGIPRKQGIGAKPPRRAWKRRSRRKSGRLSTQYLFGAVCMAPDPTRSAGPSDTGGPGFLLPNHWQQKISRVSLAEEAREDYPPTNGS